jgi:hypothetical protein
MKMHTLERPTQRPVQRENFQPVAGDAVTATALPFVGKTLHAAPGGQRKSSAAIRPLTVPCPEMLTVASEPVPIG